MINAAWRAMAALWLAILANGCQTVATGEAERPWWHTTIHPDAVPWPLPTGDLAQIDYHNAHGAGWWDAPWVLIEQFALLPTYASWGIAELVYTEWLDGGYDYDRDEWQWRAVNWTWGVPHIILSSVNYGLVWVVDTVLHDPVAALWWMNDGEEAVITTPPLAREPY